MIANTSLAVSSVNTSNSLHSAGVFVSVSVWEICH